MRGILSIAGLILLVAAVFRCSHLWLGSWLWRAARKRGSWRRSREWPEIGICRFILWGVGTATVFLTGSLVSGLCIAALSPLLLEAGVLLRRQARSSGLEEDGLVYFHSLQGLIRSGLGLSPALFRLARVQGTPFARGMARSLADFEQGRDLEACLQGFESRLPLPLLSCFLRTLYLAYAQGLSVGGLLERMVPWLEAERDMGRRLRDQRRTALVQAGFAVVLPWLLLLFLMGLRESQFSLPARGLGWLLTVTLSWEALGVWVLWRTSAFR